MRTYINKSTIRAIPTTWNFYQCRSRLEARWLVFFSALQIEFHYESEGFKLPSGDLYLPDLFLPQVEMWAEIKPIAFTEAEKDKCKQLVDITGSSCLMLIGPPDFKTYWALHSTDNEAGCEVSERYECDYLLDIDYHRRKFYREHRLFGDTAGRWSTREDFTERYASAVHHARAERFGRAA